MGKEIQNAALLIQTLWRGKQARKKYGLSQLSEAALTNGTAFLVGNDPKIKGIEAYATVKGKTALIGTSGLRSLELICRLGNKEETAKLIIVDNSKKVISFWRKLRTLVEEFNYTDKDLFYHNFELFLSANTDLYLHVQDDVLVNFNPQYEYQDPVKYIKKLIENHGLDYVLSIIKGSVFIAQSWGDKQLFVTLKNIFELHEIDKIYAYPSNIKECTDALTSKDVQMNIELLNPTLTISSDRCPHHRIPELIYLDEGKVKPKKMPKPRDYLQEKRKALLGVLVTLTDKIDELESNPNHNKKVTECAKRLNTQLAEAINFYIAKKKSTPPLTQNEIVQAKRVFLDTCTKLINSAKPLLEKELDWGSVISNLLKSLANLVINATNAVGRTFGAKSQFTLFKPTPATLVPEVDQVELELGSS